MKYVILIHANPAPWGHPTSRFTAAGRELAEEEHAAADKEFDALLTEISESGELVSALALGDPAESKIYRWSARTDLADLITDGPYAEAKEQLAGFFVIDCASRERADAIAARFAGPGNVVELRPGA
jgi:hypothetical protein